jgi:Tol biopolymer transport system component
MRNAFALATLLVASVTALLAGAAGPAGGAPVAAPQGTIVFVSERSGNVEIYSVRADGSRLGQLTRNRLEDTRPLFSPDGSRAVFSRAVDEYSPQALWLMNADGSRQRKLAADGSNPAWSPDSSRLAYVHSGRGNTEPLVIADVDFDRRVTVRGSNFGPAWSPDGTRLAFWRRADLAIVDSDGRGLRTIRRHVPSSGSPLTWLPSGEITYAGYRSVVVVRADGRGARRLVRGAFTVAWSPDGSRFAAVDEKGRLRVGTAVGHGLRNITPKGAGRLDSPAWSPDGNWIAVRSYPAGAIYHELLVVARDGSSSRRITRLVPYPWGSENGQPRWRPRGATSARLGTRPVTPLPSETVSPRTFRAAAPGSILGLAADGRRVAVVVDFSPHCATVEVWKPGRRGVAALQRPCTYVDGRIEGTEGIALAGTRAAWLHLTGGNSLETIVVSATLARRKPVSIAYEASNADSGHGDFAQSPVGDGELLAFTIDRRCEDGENGDPPCPPGHKSGDHVAATVWRIGGHGRCPYQRPPHGGCLRVAQADGELSVLAVDAGRIAARTDTGIRLLTKNGRVLRDFALRATTAALSGNRLAIRTRRAVEVYDTDSGQLVARFPARSRLRLEDLDGDILVTASGRRVTLRRLGNGRTITIRKRRLAHAQLERPGLFVAAGARVTFTPRRDVLRRLGGNNGERRVS